MTHLTGFVFQTILNFWKVHRIKLLIISLFLYIQVYNIKQQTAGSWRQTRGLSLEHRPIGYKFLFQLLLITAHFSKPIVFLIVFQHSFSKTLTNLFSIFSNLFIIIKIYMYWSSVWCETAGRQWKSFHWPGYALMCIKRNSGLVVKYRR